MKKHHIIPAVILLAVIAGFAAVYQLYVKEQIEEFQENTARLDRLKSRIEQFESTFAGQDGRPVRPEAAVSQWRNAVQPFAEAVRRRSQYFNLGDSLQANLVPEGMEPKFHYNRELPERRHEMQLYAQQRGTILGEVFSFGIPSVDDLVGTRATVDDVNRWLRQHSFGFSIMKMLVDARARRIDQIQLWPEREEAGLLRMRTVGLSFQMTVGDLANFLRDFYGQNRYFNVNAIRITNSNLLTPTEPLLNVEMVLTQASFIEENAALAPGSVPVAAAVARPGASAGADAIDVLSRLRQSGGIRFGGDEGEGGPPRQVGQPWWKRLLPF